METRHSQNRFLLSEFQNSWWENDVMKLAPESFVCLVTRLLSGSEAGVDLVSIQTSCFSYVNAN